MLINTPDEKDHVNIKSDVTASGCALCGLETGRRPSERMFAGEKKTFCCLGCMNVYAILLESGVMAAGADPRETELFKRSLAMGLISNSPAAAASPKSMPENTPTQEALFQVSGMWCSSCAWLIEHALVNELGVVSAEAFFASDLVKVRYCPQFVPPDRIPARIKQLGYTAREYTGESDGSDAERRDLLLRLGISAFLWLNIMYLSTTLYIGYFEEIAESVRRYIPFVLMVLTAPVVFYSAAPILRLMWQGFLNRTVRMETLLGIGILAAYFYSSVQAFTGGDHVYFDTASAIVTLVLVGKVIERGAKDRTARSITLLYRMMPKKVRMLAAGVEKFVSIDALNVDDSFIVKAGERMPADGIVIEGNSHADESLLTGESAPVEKPPGSRVVAGSVNISGVLNIRATRIGNDTTLAQIIRMVEQAMSNKSSLERTVDKVSRVFVPAVILVAALTFLVYWLGQLAGFGDSLMRAITVLVIACPCALGMATPLAVTAAIGISSRRGILVSDSSVLETVSKVDTIIFDKTGTITEGDFTLTDFELSHLNSRISEATKNEAMAYVASLERYSEHPLGRAVVKSAEDAGVALIEAGDIEILKGQGITGLMDGHRVFAGNRRLLEAEGAGIDDRIETRAADLEKAGRTVAFFGWDGEFHGLMAFGDRIKSDAAEVLDSFKQRGVATMIVSGDAKDTTAWVAEAAGAGSFIAEALPADKTAIIERLQAGGKVVAMVGDGVNDAPALAQADLGFALGTGTDIAMRAASVVLMNSSLGKTLEFFDLSKKTWRIVRQNLFWAFLYNTLSISLAVTGFLNPIYAAVAMLLSSLSVIGNSMRLSR
ncbi:MAG: heavy metal translocating P-type ATPase [Acidobacteria bacterium]|nr:heavy metal translocating P-type ATPase [Acidobacteriota bacterium]